MSKLKVVKNINLVLNIIIILASLMFITLRKFNEKSYYVMIFTVVGLALLNLIFIIIKLSVDMDYNFKTFTPVIHASYLVISILMYYILKNFGNFSSFGYVYWLCLMLGNAIAVTIFVILNVKYKEKKPKFITNRR